MANPKETVDHRFLDEAGDTTFYGKGKVPIIGKMEGISNTFIMGLVRVKGGLPSVREKIKELAKYIENDKFFQGVPSIDKRKLSGGFFFHAKNDNEAVRKVFFDFLQNVNFSFEAVIARKIYGIFAKKHDNSESEFYADLLSHLIKSKLTKGGKMVLNISQRNNSTNQKNLDKALEKAVSRKGINPETKIVFNVQDHRLEPLLNIADYMCWSIQRLVERGDTRYHDLVASKIKLIVDIYDMANYNNFQNYYNYPKRQLTAKNKIGPA